jgi:hypothetical protein
MSKSPLKAIRSKCLDRSCGSHKEVRLCPVTECALYPFRFGKNPFVKRKGNPEALKRWMERKANAVRHENAPILSKL